MFSESKLYLCIALTVAFYSVITIIGLLFLRGIEVVAPAGSTDN